MRSDFRTLKGMQMGSTPVGEKKCLLFIVNPPTRGDAIKALTHKLERMKGMYPHVSLEDNKVLLFSDHPHIYFSIKAMMEELGIPTFGTEGQGVNAWYIILRGILPNKSLQGYLNRCSERWLGTHEVMMEFQKVVKKMEKGIPLIKFEDYCERISMLMADLRRMQEYDFSVHEEGNTMYEEFLNELKSMLLRLRQELHTLEMGKKSRAIKLRPELSLEAQLKLAGIRQEAARNVFFTVKEMTEAGEECNNITLMQKMNLDRATIEECVHVLVEKGLLSVSMVPSVIRPPREVYELAPGVMAKGLETGAERKEYLSTHLVFGSRMPTTK